MSGNTQLVLVLGATGFTGRSIVNGLLKAGQFRVAALIRPVSLSKPETERLRAAGVEIREGDVTDDYEKLKKVVEGVDILISAVYALVIPFQRDIFRAAKEMGVKRVVPCDFATPGAKGVRSYHDIKLGIREYVKGLGVGYTIIDVGWWMQLFLPLPFRSAAPESAKQRSWTISGDGERPNLLTNLDHIGTWVARIIADPRTLNQAVIVWEDEVTANVAQDIGVSASGDGDALKAKRIHVSAEEVKRLLEEGKKEYAEDPKNVAAIYKLLSNEYAYSMSVLGENTLENAKKLGYLDARELYPDIPVQSFAEYAKEFYSLKEPGEVYRF
ncbi:NAD(P)-binding protein [Earliella scabrosa]|nr:NAD(P)-binding protein [Earliella scabrosa]